MQGLFEVASGSITGRNHFLVGKNNQDAYFSTCTDQALIAVVCDGCGSGAHSEVGAKLGARLVVAAIAQQLQASQFSTPFNVEFWEQVKLNLLVQLQGIAKSLCGHESVLTNQVVNDYLLFTIVGVVITPTTTTTFSLGDGLTVVNGKINQIPPFPDNAPPYLTYGLYRPDLISFQIREQLHTDTVQSILIGTDGVGDLIAAATQNLPGKKEIVGEISQFWQEDRYFTNPDMIRRRLAMINREATKLNWQSQQMVRASGLLIDDTTLIVVRRKELSQS